MRKSELFIQEKGHLLGNHGFIPDKGKVEYTSTGKIVLYHYTRAEHLEQILAPNSGLHARLPVIHMDVAPELAGHHLVETLLEPLPEWLSNCPYLEDFGLQMMKKYVGNTLLRLELPADFAGLYVVDKAHNFDRKYETQYGKVALGLEYDPSNGRESCLAEIHSIIRLQEYLGGHVAPNPMVTRVGQGIAVPVEYLSINPEQPLQ